MYVNNQSQVLEKVKIIIMMNKSLKLFFFVNFLYCFIYIFEVYFIKKVLSIKIFRNVVQTYFSTYKQTSQAPWPRQTSVPINFFSGFTGDFDRSYHVHSSIYH